MKQNFKNVYQFKLSMRDITPQIWRRIQVPENYTFLDLHYAIQAAMEWEDYHLHEFEILNPKIEKIERIGTESDDFEDFGEESGAVCYQGRGDPGGEEALCGV